VEGYSSVSIVVYIAEGRESEREKQTEKQKERDPISTSERGSSIRVGGGEGGRRAGDGARERDGDRGREKENKYGGGGCYGYTAAITIRVPSYSKLLQSSPRSVSVCVS